jgi:hypothetical protein
MRKCSKAEMKEIEEVKNETRKNAASFLSVYASANEPGRRSSFTSSTS